MAAMRMPADLSYDNLWLAIFIDSSQSLDRRPVAGLP
ncbi:hypothetical protein [Microvirga sp. P5_D2]